MPHPAGHALAEYLYTFPPAETDSICKCGWTASNGGGSRWKQHWRRSMLLPVETSVAHSAPAVFSGDPMRVFELHIFQKKSTRGAATPKTDIGLIRERLKVADLPHKGGSFDELHVLPLS